MTGSFKCSNCGDQHRRKGQRNCAACHANYMREWRRTHPLNSEHRKRDKARSIASVAKKSGHLKPEPCRVCGAQDAEMHHPDHELPHVVEWLCRDCHLAWHAYWRLTALRIWNYWLGASSTKEGRAA